MATVTATTAATPERKPIRWRTVWNVLVVTFWVALLIGIIGDFFIFRGKGSTILGFKENGTLWNWLQLLSAPVFVTVLPFVFGRPQAHQASDKVDEEQKPASDPQQETLMNTYLSQMSELLLEKNLAGSPSGSQIQGVAQAWTLTVLRRVDKNHTGAVLQFLHEAGLIYKNKAIIDLRDADLSGADLSRARLNGSNLEEVDLSRASLNGTILSGANMRGTNLSGADLSGANLSGATVTAVQLAKASSLQGTIMPDGSRHL